MPCTCSPAPSCPAPPACTSRSTPASPPPSCDDPPRAPHRLPSRARYLAECTGHSRAQVVRSARSRALDGRMPGMNASHAFAAVDLGATSGRVMIGRVSETGVELELVSRFPNGLVERADGLHWDLDALYDNVVAGLAEAVRRAPGIESIGIDSWAVDYGLLRDGVLLAQPFHYRDERSVAGVEQVHAIVPFAQLYTRN